MYKRVVLYITILALICPTAQAGEIEGKVHLKDRRGRVQDYRDNPVLVYISSPSSKIPRGLLEETLIVSTEDKQFSPQLMAVPRGGQVRFPNMDPIIHNVFSVSKGNEFDAGQYDQGDGSTHRFNEPGVVRIYCNVHHDMNAVLIVVDSPWYTLIDNQGRFQLKNLPAGEYEIRAHIRGAAEEVQTIKIPANGTAKVEFTFTLRKFRPPPHLNKFGKPYKKARSRKY